MAPTYKTLVQISGTRDGVDWPRPGEPIELPEAEAADYLAAGIVGPMDDDAETSTARKPETATTKRRRGSAKQRAAQTPPEEPKDKEPKGEPGADATDNDEGKAS